ncbi:hypothetical protein VTO42DRAFT_3380 [Malbranchea cinnamomea]
MSQNSRATGTFPPASDSSSRQSMFNPSLSTQQSSMLAARIASKRAELEDLKQLRDVSNALAAQMEMLEQKLATLRDGTEAVACVMANWDNVLRAINMASTNVSQIGEKRAAESAEDVPPLPAPLVRIPAEQPTPQQ